MYANCICRLIRKWGGSGDVQTPNPRRTGEKKKLVYNKHLFYPSFSRLQEIGLLVCHGYIYGHSVIEIGLRGPPLACLEYLWLVEPSYFGQFDDCSDAVAAAAPFGQKMQQKILRSPTPPLKAFYVANSSLTPKRSTFLPHSYIFRQNCTGIVRVDPLILLQGKPKKCI